MAATKGDSKKNLIAAAEALFAEKGFDASTTREIAAKSGDTLGTLSHHFGSKENILIEVVNQRFPKTHELRKSYREAFKKMSGGKSTLENAIASIVMPFMELAICGGEGWRNYTILIAQIIRGPNERHRKIIREIRHDHVQEYLGWMKEVLPHSSEDDIVYDYECVISMMIGTFIEFEYNPKNGNLSQRERDSELTGVALRLMTVLIGGLKGQRKSPSKELEEFARFRGFTSETGA